MQPNQEKLKKTLTELLINKDDSLAVVLISSWMEGLIFTMDYNIAEKTYDDMLERFIITADENIDSVVLGRFIVKTHESTCAYRQLAKKGYINIIPMNEVSVLTRH